MIKDIKHTNLDSDNIDNEKIVIKYYLAGMATFIRATGANLVEARLNPALGPMIEVNENNLFYGFNSRCMGNNAQVIISSRMSSSALSAARMAIAQIGAVAAGREAVFIAELGHSVSLKTTQAWAKTKGWYDSICGNFSSSIRIEGDYFPDVIRRGVKNVVLANWEQVVKSHNVMEQEFIAYMLDKIPQHFAISTRRAEAMLAEAEANKKADDEYERFREYL